MLRDIGYNGQVRIRELRSCSWCWSLGLTIVTQLAGIGLRIADLDSVERVNLHR
ncbi:MAG: hypothetical protein ACUVUS_04865 [Thermoproteota archaeon]